MFQWWLLPSKGDSHVHRRRNCRNYPCHLHHRLVSATTVVIEVTSNLPVLLAKQRRAMAAIALRDQARARMLAYAGSVRSTIAATPKRSKNRALTVGDNHEQDSFWSISWAAYHHRQRRDRGGDRY